MAKKPGYINMDQRVKELKSQIPDGKLAEVAQIESEEKYRQLFNIVTDAIMLFDAETRHFIDANDTALSLYGYSREEFLKLRHQDITAEPKKSDASIRQILEGELVRIPVRYHKKKDGTIFPVEISASTCMLRNRKVICGVIRDITERNQTEKALRESEAEKTALLDAAIDRIRHVDKDMKIIWGNKAAVDASGMSPEDMVGKTCYQLFVGGDTPCKGCPTLRSKETGRIERAVIHLPKAKRIIGQSYWDVYCIPLKNEPGNPESFIQIARNITEQIRAEEQIHTLTHELMKAQESERQMISRELHDRVAQQLAVAKIDCELLLNHHPAIHPEIRRKISEMTITLQESIKAVRDLSYDLRPPALDVMGLVDTLSQYCHDFSENNGISVDFSTAGMKDLKLDFDTEINLYRLVIEGLTNIKKHADASHVIIKLVAVSPNIILRIEDNGRGFDVQERLAKITKEKRMGIRSIEERVKLLQGEMALRSKPKQGTKIFIKFPYKGKKVSS